jgi:hypothetical protein
MVYSIAIGRSDVCENMFVMKSLETKWIMANGLDFASGEQEEIVEPKASVLGPVPAVFFSMTEAQSFSQYCCK